jgi:uncharacterized membrane protein YfcA
MTMIDTTPRNPVAAFGGGAIIGALGGLIGLGGAEFRLPLLIGMFRFAALEAVILNKAMSLVVVATALPFRAGTVPFSAIADHWPIVLNLLAGSLIGAWFGAGFIIGIVAAVLGVAGGELLIPTLVLLFGADIKLAGSLSLAVSLPTMLVGFTRYSRDQSFSVLGRNKIFMLMMAAGSIAGTFIGGLLLGIVPNAVLLPALAIILLISAVKVWRH